MYKIWKFFEKGQAECVQLLHAINCWNKPWMYSRLCCKCKILLQWRLGWKVLSLINLVSIFCFTNFWQISKTNLYCLYSWTKCLQNRCLISSFFMCKVLMYFCKVLMSFKFLSKLKCIWYIFQWVLSITKHAATQRCS